MVGLKTTFLRYWKIHTNKHFLCLILLLSMLYILFTNKAIYNSIVAYAASNEASSDTIDSDDSDADQRRVYDDAGLLSPYEIKELETISKDYGDKAGIEIFILTHDDSNSTYPEKYIQDFEDQLPIGDRVYFLYDVYRGEIFMEGYGLAETYIHSKRVDEIFDMVENFLRNEHYYDAFKTYINMSSAYMEDESELNYDHGYIYDKPPKDFDPDNEYGYDDYHYDRHYRQEAIKDNIFFNFWFQLLVALGIGGVVVGSLTYKSSGRMTTGARDYLDRSRKGLIGRRDQYIRSTVTKWRKPSQNSSSGGSRGGGRGGFNSGGFRGGTSSGGRSHSSGGRKL